MQLKDIDQLNPERLAGIRSMLETIRQYWGVCMVLLMISAIMWITPKVEKYLNDRTARARMDGIMKGLEALDKKIDALTGPPSAEKILSQVSREDEVSRFIDEKLSRLCVDTGAKRAQWYRLHDGYTDTVSGVHYYFYSLVNEAVSGGVSEMCRNPEMTRIPVSNFPRVTASMRTKTVENIIVSAMETDSWARRLWSANGVGQVITCPVYAGDGTPMGFAALHYEHPVSAAGPSEALNDFAKVMEGILLR